MSRDAKEVARIGRWKIVVSVANGSGVVWTCGALTCSDLTSHYYWQRNPFSGDHHGNDYSFSVEVGRHWWGAKKRTVSEAIMAATDEALQRHTQDLADTSAAKVAEEIAEEIGIMVRDRLETA